MSNAKFGAALLTLFLLLASIQAQTYEGQQLVKARLLAGTTAIVPGQPCEVGLLLEMAPGWHTYWEYSGDAGLPTKIEWVLPEGFAAGPIQWPTPQAIIEPGDIWTYGYGHRVLLITTIVAPSEASMKKNIVLHAKASWLVCNEICVPGSAELELQLPIATSAKAANDELFNEFRAQIPSALTPPYQLEWQREKTTATLKILDLPHNAPISFYPLPTTGQNVGHPMVTASNIVKIPVVGEIRGVLAVGSEVNRRAWYVTSNHTQATLPTGLWMALFYGFVGGFILNLMPCVLPVISLKIFGFIKQAHESRGRIFAHGLAFAAGIFVWFLGLGAIVVALKSSGTEVTWAFQFQNPWFNIIIGSVVFVFTLNLFGVFEIILPGRASTALESSGSVSGLGGSFFQGVFATLLATPCTAPFLGSALGFAFSQSAPIILAMFGSVATGMALPYLLLTAQPGWMKFLPRPGAWMERLKQFMGFPLLATLVWILSILGAQRGLAGVIWFTSFLLCLALACWLYGSFCGHLSSRRTRLIALILAVGVSVWGGWYFLGEKLLNSGPQKASGIAWVPFSSAELTANLSAEKSVFVDFTADWCITCKFNEKTAIDTSGVRALLAEKHVVSMKADWTNANPEITAALKKFGRVGVPFYIIYPAGRANDPVILPELLTEDLLVEALKKLP